MGEGKVNGMIWCNMVLCGMAWLGLRLVILITVRSELYNMACHDM